MCQDEALCGNGLNNPEMAIFGLLFKKFNSFTGIQYFISLPNSKLVNQSILKALCRQQNKCDEKQKFVVRTVENFVGKGENADYQHFLLFPQCFQKVSLSGSLKSGLCGKGLNIRKDLKYCVSKNVFKSVLTVSYTRVI